MVKLQKFEFYIQCSSSICQIHMYFTCLLLLFDKLLHDLVPLFEYCYHNLQIHNSYVRDLLQASKLWSSLEERNLEARGKVSDDSPRGWYFQKGFRKSCFLRIKRVSRILFRSIKRCLQPVRVWRLNLLSQPAQADIESEE